MTDTSLIVQSLLSRLTPSRVKPLTSKEFWGLVRIAHVSDLPGLSAADLGLKFGVKPDVAERVPVLLDRGRAMALAFEELEHRGVWVATAGDERYPSRLRDRLGDAAPAMLYGVGDVGLLQHDGIGVVGSRDIGIESSEVAAAVARYAATHDVPVVSGAARGVDSTAMKAAFEAEGKAVGVLAESLLRFANDSSVRRAVASGQLCLVTPYSPSAPFSAGNAMGRNKIIYGLSKGTVVVRSDDGSGGTWAGAVEAIKNEFGIVWSWLGAGAGPGNQPLVDRGARSLRNAEGLGALLSAPSADGSSSAAESHVALTLF